MHTTLSAATRAAVTNIATARAGVLVTETPHDYLVNNVADMFDRSPPIVTTLVRAEVHATSADCGAALLNSRIVKAIDAAHDLYTAAGIACVKQLLAAKGA
jgi:copper oxidase (laccase) domain-containing protein